MNRRDFLKSIGYVASASILPPSLLPLEPEILDPIALENERYPQIWVGNDPGSAMTSAAFFVERS